MSVSNNEIKLIRSLDSVKGRNEAGLFVVEGEKMLEEALNSSFEVVKVYRKDEIGETAMSKISKLSSPSPVLAVLKKPSDVYSCDYDKILPESGLFLMLDSIRDPGNLGTILRISDWFGISGIFASSDTVDIFNSKVVQATMGAIFRVRFHYTDLLSLSDYISDKGGAVYGTFLDGENIYSKALDNGKEKPSAIVIGNEANGISVQLSQKVSERLYISTFPQDRKGSESLNAAIATAITIAEFRRRLI